jgi:hypothetical protein
MPRLASTSFTAPRARVRNFRKSAPKLPSAARTPPNNAADSVRIDASASWESICSSIAPLTEASCADLLASEKAGARCSPCFDGVFHVHLAAHHRFAARHREVTLISREKALKS